jgi:tRNA-dihydrouridine synthase C
MIGRGALCRPDLPRLISADHNADSGTEALQPLAWQEVAPLVLQYFDLNLAAYDAHHVGNPLKQWLVYLRAYYPQAALLFEQLKRLRAPQELREVLARSLVSAAPTPTAA